MAYLAAFGHIAHHRRAIRYAGKGWVTGAGSTGGPWSRNWRISVRVHSSYFFYRQLSKNTAEREVYIPSCEARPQAI